MTQENYHDAMNAPIERDTDLPITMHDDEAEEMTAPLMGLAGAAFVLVALCAAVVIVLGVWP